MRYSNYHTHTNYCDGNNTPEELVTAAIKMGCPEIGFTGHGRTPFDMSYCMDSQDTENYISDLLELRNKYDGRIDILIGIERDYYGTDEDYKDNPDIDYTIGSVHYVKKNGDYLPVDESPELLVEYVAKYYNGDVYALCEDYFATVADVYRKTRCDIIGHFDLISKFNEGNALFDASDDRYVKAALDALDSIEASILELDLEKPVYFEINTGAISRGYRKNPYPDDFILNEMKKRGLNLILSSDCHNAQDLLCSFDRYDKLIKDGIIKTNLKRRNDSVNKKILRSEERAVLSLRSLYKQRGFMPYKMSKFEEYELYLRNKDFLSTDKIITFYDTNGKLMAMKPDVTLSIIRQSEDTPGVTQRLYYDESIYRASGNSKVFKEIKQAGVESIGDLDLLDIVDTLLLSAQSLAEISDEYVINVSHLGILNALLSEMTSNEDFAEESLAFIKEKNTHDLAKLGQEYSVPASCLTRLQSLMSIYGPLDKALVELESICTSEKTAAGLEDLKTIYSLISGTEYADKFFLDFSIINDLKYYNDIVFNGYINGIYESILSGGQYDKLMAKLGKKSRGIGFAINLDLLETLRKETTSKSNIDYLILYTDESDIKRVYEERQKYLADGYTVSIQKAIPKKLRYENLIDLRREAK